MEKGNEMKKVQVGCAGILVADTICGPMPALPREGQLLAVDHMPTRPGGCAANVAIDLAKQGVTVDVAGCLGKDAAAHVLLDSFNEYQIGTQRIVYSPELMTSKTAILLVAGQDRRYIHSFGANAAFKVSDIDHEWVRQLQVFYLGGLFLMPAFDPQELTELLKFCRSQGVVTVVDVVIPENATLPVDLRPLLKEVDYFLPNDDEAQRLTGLSDPLAQLRRLVEWGARHVIITLGRRGAIAARKRTGASPAEYWKAGIYSIPNAVDPSGCGDAFDAGLITGILHGWDMPTTLRYASALGGSATRALGTTDGVFNAAEAEQFIHDNPLEIETGWLEE